MKRQRFAVEQQLPTRLRTVCGLIQRRHPCLYFAFQLALICETETKDRAPSLSFFIRYFLSPSFFAHPPYPALVSGSAPPLFFRFPLPSALTSRMAQHKTLLFLFLPPCCLLAFLSLVLARCPPLPVFPCFPCLLLRAFPRFFLFFLSASFPFSLGNGPLVSLFCRPFQLVTSSAPSYLCTAYHTATTSPLCCLSSALFFCVSVPLISLSVLLFLPFPSPVSFCSFRPFLPFLSSRL